MKSEWTQSADGRILKRYGEPQAEFVGVYSDYDRYHCADVVHQLNTWKPLLDALKALTEANEKAGVFRDKVAEAKAAIKAAETLSKGV